MVERPILFSGPMVLAILAGRKTVTRRIAKFAPLDPGFNLGFSGVSAGHYNTGNPGSGHVLYSRGAGGVWNQRTKPLHCPYGLPGDRLWVRETWYCDHAFVGDHVGTCAGCVGCSHTDADRIAEWRELLEFRADHDCRSWEAGCPCTEGEWRPSIFMPRWASRLTLSVESVRVERLQDISEEDARAEGVERFETGWRDYEPARPGEPTGACYAEARDSFRSLWESINGERPGCSWAANPWVWAITFKVAEVRRG